MATTACPACGLTVPYFCCEGLVCPACGYDEERPALPAGDVKEGGTPQHVTGQPLAPDADAPQSAIQ